MTVLWRAHRIVSLRRTTPTQQVRVGSSCSAVGLKNLKKIYWFLDFVNFIVFQTEHFSKTGSLSSTGEMYGSNLFSWVCKIANVNYWVICQLAQSVTVLEMRFFQWKIYILQ